MLLIFLFLVLSAYGLDDKNFQIICGDFTVKVNGMQQVPKYEYWLGDSSTPNKLQFVELYECLDAGLGLCSRVPKSTVSLAHLDWNISQPIQEDGIYSFNITSSPFQDRFSSLVIVNYMLMDEKVDGKKIPHGFNHSQACMHAKGPILEKFCTQPNVKKQQLKFSIYIYDYHFKQKNSSLVLDYLNVVEDNSYFDVEPIAFAISQEGETTFVNVTLRPISLDRTSIIYKGFPGGTLYHDPSFGYDRQTLMSAGLSLMAHTFLWIVIGVLASLV